MFQMHRVFCATPWEMEARRFRFHELVGRFNETHAMAHGVLYVPVSLLNIRDKRPTQYVVEENIRDSRYYIQMVSDDWGPIERNFEEDYHLALEFKADPALPMKDVVLLRQAPRSGRPLAEGVPEPERTLSTMEEFDECLQELFTKWLEATLDEGRERERHTTA